MSAPEELTFTRITTGEHRQMNTTPFIVTERPNGRASVKTAYFCLSEADFVGRIRELALQRRSDAAMEIDTVDQAADYLNSTFAQRTELVGEEEFKSTEGWDRVVLKAAQNLGWYESPDEDVGEEEFKSTEEFIVNFHQPLSEN